MSAHSPNPTRSGRGRQVQRAWSMRGVGRTDCGGCTPWQVEGVDTSKRLDDKVQLHGRPPFMAHITVLLPFAQLKRS